MIHLLKNGSKILGLKLLVSIGITELLIMLLFRFSTIESLLPPFLVDFADALLLSIIASVMIFYWVVNPMKIFEERRKAADLLQEQKKFAESLIDNTAVAAFVLDPTHKVMYWNKAAEELFGVQASALIGTDEHWKAYYREKRLTLSDMVIDNDYDKIAVLYPAYRESTLAPDAVHVEGWFKKLNGKDRYLLLDAAPIFDSSGNLAAVIETQQDITDRKEAEEQAYFLAYYDKLTNLPNRHFFKELLSRNVENARRYEQKFAVVALGLGNFRRINDTLGFYAGEQLLKNVAEKLVGTFRRSDYLSHLSATDAPTVAHMGGDEFMVLLHDVSHVQDAGRLAERILRIFSTPFEVAGHEIRVSANVGITMFPEDGEDAESHLRNVDTALQHARSMEKSGYQFYSRAMNESALELLQLENDLHRAIERNELLLYYQPKMDLKTHRIVGMESLIRWKRPEIGIVPPGKFIPLAESSGLIVPIGKFVLQTACVQLKSWQDVGMQPLSVAVNLSTRQFEQKDLISDIKSIVAKSGLDPQYLEIELTESSVMRNPEEAIRVLDELKATGFKITVDDFGTGYSSLSYLKRLPLSSLKIDISFVRNMLTNPNDEVIVKTIIGMAHSLNVKTVAEGVETAQQSELLKKLGCDEIQGYLLSPPVPAEQFPKLLFALENREKSDRPTDDTKRPMNLR